jgi:hypothetical protein
MENAMNLSKLEDQKPLISGLYVGWPFVDIVAVASSILATPVF